MTIFNQYEKDGYLIKEYPNGSVVKSFITQAEKDFSSGVIQPSIKEEILYETKYQTLILEMGAMM